jgi:cytidyltransferase-like protein
MRAKLTIVVASGYFDPLHVGHIEYLEKAKQLGDELVVIVNSDVQAKIKKGRAFMREEDRLKIVKSIKYVDTVFLSVDENKTVRKSLKKIKKIYPKDKIVFTNGGDRKEEEIPETKTCRKLGIEIVDGLGKKIRSSSDYNKNL